MRITLGAVVKGGTSIQYKTGRWRDEKPVLNTALCNVCGICDMVCPDSAVHAEGAVYVIDYDYCKGCGLCAHECPVDAITMMPEVK